MKRNLYFFISLIVLSFFSYHTFNFKIDASSDTLVSQNDKDFIFFNEYSKIFESKNFLVLAIKGEKEIDKNLLTEIDNISKKLKKLKGIENTFSINDAPILFINNSSLQELSSQNIETILNTKHSINDSLNEFVSNPMINNQLINAKKNVTSIIIYLNENNEFKKLKNKNISLLNSKEKRNYYKIKNELNNQRKNLINNIRNIIEESDPNYKYYLGGIDLIADDVISFVKKDIMIFSIAVLIIIVIILFFIFREFKWIIICLSTSVYAVISMFGILGLLNLEVTAISSNFVSLMFILSISMNIHIINYYKQNYNKNHNYIFETLKKMFWPCLYTVLTTMVAFTSLIISDIKPIIDFGIIMILSLLVIITSSFTILPLFISFYPNFKNSISINFSILNTFFNLSVKFYKQIILFNIIVLIISIFGISKLNVENSFINYFKKNTDIYKGMKLIDTELGGTTPLDILITFKNENNENFNEINIDDDEILEDDELLSDDLFGQIDSNSTWFTLEKLAIIKNIHNYLENKKEIGTVQSLQSILEVANRLNKNPLTVFELSVLYNEIPENYKINLLDPYLSTEKNMVRISSRVKDSEDINRNLLINDINLYLKDNYKNLVEYRVNGLLVLYNNMLQSLFSSQIKSLGFVIVAIFIMFIILFKSLKLSILGIIPNIIASGSILGLIGLFKIPLDIMTITIAAITVGIAVDNTIHYLYRYTDNIKNNFNTNESIKMAHNSVGYAVLTTSISVAMGFSVLALSNFIPTILFGIFTSLAMIIAMLGVLLTLPTLLKVFYK